jgi:hypothetical protein
MSARPLYARVEYARAFGGPIIELPEWGAALLRRSIPGTELEDALGCYPLSLIEAEADLRSGLERLRAAKLVSVSLVPDPITGPAPEKLAAAFPICRAFKRHYLIDRALGAVRLSTTHRRWLRKALRECEIRVVPLRDSLGDWMRLYRGTIKRHAITGVQKFSREYFAALAELPGVTAFAASSAGETVAMALWVENTDIIYYHLGASDRRGYDVQAMYGIFAAAQEHFSSAHIFHLGGAAGIAPNEEDGLARFKRGFANRAVEAYFCGASLDPQRYAALSKGRENAAFFPAYREP